MHRPRLGPAVLLVVASAVALAGCKARRHVESPPAPARATARIDALVREHPAYPWLRHLAAPASPYETAPATPRSNEKAEALPELRDSKAKVQRGPRLRVAVGDRSVAGITDEARALKEEHERFRDAQMPSRTEVEATPEPGGPARGSDGDDALLRRRQLASTLRRETVDACRHIAVEHGIDLTLPPDVPADAEDMTERFRGWLRAHWQEAEPAAHGGQGVTR